MLDRASTFADKGIIELLKSRFVPVAIDQAYQRRQQDAEGDFYRKIAGQSPRNNFESTTQGLYTAGPDGKLFGFTNHRGADRVREMLTQSLNQYKPSEAAALDRGDPDERYNPLPPEGGLIVRVQTKVIDGYEKTQAKWREIFQQSISRDNLWITKKEHELLVRGEFPRSLQLRMARFHLVDNTRGEPPMWRSKELREVDFKLNQDSVSGKAKLSTESGDRTFDAQLSGTVETDGEKVTSFDLVAQGDFKGEGRYTRGAPTGKFPLAILFTLADGSDIADKIPPQGSRGWVEGYLNVE